MNLMEQNGILKVDVEENSGLQTIGKYAFYECENLCDITLPSSLSTIGKSAFYNYYGYSKELPRVHLCDT